MRSGDSRTWKSSVASNASGSESAMSSSPSVSVGLLDEALGLGANAGVSWPWQVALVLDCVETNGAFVLHHLLKRALSAADADRGAVVFLALAQPFSHYDRVLRKMGCNLSVQRNKNRLHFFDLLNLRFSGETFSESVEVGLLGLYNKILRVIEASNPTEQITGHITLIIDDLSLLEIAAHGSMGNVLDFLQYCITLTSEMDCSLVILNHEDIYPSEEESWLLSYLEYLSDVVIKTEPLSTGIAADVHGQLTVASKGSFTNHGHSTNTVRNFQFKLKENGVEYFYPGSRH